MAKNVEQAKFYKFCLTERAVLTFSAGKKSQRTNKIFKSYSNFYICESN